MLRVGTNLTETLTPAGSDLTIGWETLLDGTVIVGGSGSGKTTLMGHLVQEVILAGHIGIVFDTSGDLTRRWKATAGSPVAGFSDNPDPANPKVQLNEIDMVDLSALLRQPGSGSVHSETWIEESAALARAFLDALGYRTRGLTPEQALMQTIILKAWGNGIDLDLSSLASQVADPPFDMLGAFHVDAAIRLERRMELSRAIQGVAAEATSSGAFGPLDFDDLVAGPSGESAALIVSFSRRSHVERRLLIALLLAKLGTWIAHRPDVSDFNGVICIDDAASFVPAEGADYPAQVLREVIDTWPTHGFGALLSVEHSYELHPSVLDLCETWMVGATPVARARRAVIEELDLMNPPVDEKALDMTLRTMDPGQFIIRSSRETVLKYAEVGP